MIEYEMKFKCDHDIMKEKLKEIKAKFHKSDFNYDTYFQHPCHDYSETDEALRIRESNNKRKLTYKGPKFNNQSKTREELEIEVETEKFSSLFGKLGFVTSGTVRKERSTWKSENYTIVLDNVENLGEFIEIEVVKENDDDYENTIKELYNFVRKLGLNPKNQILRSYLELVLSK